MSFEIYCVNCGKLTNSSIAVDRGFCSLRCKFDFSPSIKSINKPEKEEEYYLDNYVGQNDKQANEEMSDL